MNFDRAAFFVMAVVAAGAVALAGGLTAWQGQRVVTLQQELAAQKTSNLEFQHAFKRLADRLSDPPLPPRPRGAVGEAPPR
jgi:hypothetical protein